MATRKPKTQEFRAGALTESVSAGDLLTVSALAFYEGEHTSMGGQTTTYGKEDLEAIATATNAYLSSGRRIKLYASDNDHLKISQGTAIGTVEGSFSVEQITSDRLPSPLLADLVGKWGLYCQIKLADEGAIAQFRTGLLREISIGLTADNTIIEISAVAMPALAGAALFSLPKQGDYHFGLSLSEQIQEDEQAALEMRIWRLWDAFSSVLASIRDATPEELAGRNPDDLRRTAIADLAAGLTAYLSVPAPEQPRDPLPVVPMFSTDRGDMTQSNQTPENPVTPAAETPVDQQFAASQFAEMQRTIAAQQEQLAQFKREQAVTLRFTALQRRAHDLKAAGKLTPAQITKLFGANEQEAIARFSASDAAIAGLDAIDMALDVAELNQPIRFGLLTDGEPLPPADGAPEKERDFSWYKPTTVTGA